MCRRSRKLTRKQSSAMRALLNVIVAGYVANYLLVVTARICGVSQTDLRTAQYGVALEEWERLSEKDRRATWSCLSRDYTKDAPTTPLKSSTASSKKERLKKSD